MSSKATETTDRKHRRFRNINGVMHYSCSACNELKPQSEFWRDKRGERNGSIPVRSQCKPCQKRIEAERRASKSPAEKKAEQERWKKKAAERRKELIALDKELKQKIKSANSIELPEWVIEKLREDIKPYGFMEGGQFRPGIHSFADHIGIGQDVLSRILNGRKTSVNRATAENIFMHCEAHEELEELFPVIASKKWAKNHDCCIQCGTIRVTHAGKGLCSTCKSRKDRGNPFERIAEKQWSTYHTKCIRCSTTSREGAKKHCSRGLCVSCYDKMKRRMSTAEFDKHYPRTTNRHVGTYRGHKTKEAMRAKAASEEFHL